MNKSFKWIVVLTAFVVVGFFSYRAGQNSMPPEKTEEAVKNELVELTQKDFEEYQNLKTLEDRYKKADEILGKIVTVFLADLGLRLGYKPTIPSMFDTACALPTPAPAVAATPTPPMSTPTPTPAPEPPAPNNWKKNEPQLLAIRDETAALDELRKMEVTDLFTTLKSSQKLSQTDALNIEGTYMGEISFFSRQDHKTDWTLSIEISVNRSSPNVQANTLIVITEKKSGKRLSRTRGGGNMKDFMRVPDSKALFVDVYGNDGYIQVYPQDGSQVWLGNYYEKTGLGTFRMSGQVRLTKQ